MYNVVVLVGSIRPNSINRKFALALEKLAAGKLSFDYADLGSLPYYDDSLWDNPPESVLRLKSQVEAADAVLFVTPEYNRSFPGLLKNAIDWPSRPYGRSVWSGKPAAIVGTTTGQIGTAAAQASLRSVLAVLDLIVMGQPEIYFQMKPGLVEEDGNVTDEKTAAFLSSWVERFTGFIARVGEPRQVLAAAE